MNCTCAFSALPNPTTLFLISSGEYSPNSNPASAIANKATPRTCARVNADFTFRPWNTCFHSRSLGAMLVDHTPQSQADFMQPDRHRLLGTGADDATRNQLMPHAIRLDYPIPGPFRPAIDSQDSHDGTRAAPNSALPSRSRRCRSWNNVLHIVVLFQRFRQTDHRRCVLALHFDEVLGYHRDLR